MIEDAFQANGISLMNNFTNLYLDDNLFLDFWNTFVDMEDVSPQFAVEDVIDATCVADCVIAPCPDTTIPSSSATAAVQSRQRQPVALFAVAAILSLLF